MDEAFEPDDAVGPWQVSRRQLVQAGAGLASVRPAGLAAAQQPREAAARACLRVSAALTAPRRT